MVNQTDDNLIRRYGNKCPKVMIGHHKDSSKTKSEKFKALINQNHDVNSATYAIKMADSLLALNSSSALSKLADFSPSNVTNQCVVYHHSTNSYLR